MVATQPVAKVTMMSDPLKKPSKAVEEVPILLRVTPG